jgi:hypothetical protein
VFPALAFSEDAKTTKKSFGSFWKNQASFFKLFSEMALIFAIGGFFECFV